MITPLDAVVSHHMNPFRSGVARFNELLARELGVPLYSVFDDGLAGCSAPLLSFKAQEMSDAEQVRLLELLEGRSWELELYLHAFGGLEVEHAMVRAARRVWCGNHELTGQLADLHPVVETVWTPGLLLDHREIKPVEITVFSFGMAHKIRISMFRRLRELLDASGRSYAVMVSAANHETASMRDAEVVFQEMHEIFPEQLYFLGNLSDLAVQHYLSQATYFAAFFEHGVRANNTSVASALERGAVVITNLDRYSPPDLVHMDTVIDINSCDALPDDPLTLRRLAYRAMEAGAARSWERLVEGMRAPLPEPSR